MGMRVLPLSSSHNCFLKSIGLSSKPKTLRCNRDISRVGGIWATAEQKGKEEGEQNTSKQSLFSSITEALDFSQARSSQDAQLIEEAKEATKTGGKMNREQYGALRRKIGGTYKDFFKSYVDGQDTNLACKLPSTQATSAILAQAGDDLPLAGDLGSGTENCS